MSAHPEPAPIANTVQRRDELQANGQTIVRWRAVCPCGRPSSWRMLKSDAERDLRGYRADARRLGRCH